MNYCEREAQNSIGTEPSGRKATEKLNIFKAYGNMWKNAFNFKGRVGRNEYWLAFLGDFNVGVIFTLIIGLVWTLFKYNSVEITPVMSTIAIAVIGIGAFGWVSLRYIGIGMLMSMDKLPVLFDMPIFSWEFWLMILKCLLVVALAIVWYIPRLSILVRRLHDSGKSAWFLLLLLIPFLGADILFICVLRDSDDGDNRWGENPKGVERNPYEIKERNKLITAVGALLVNFENFKTCDSRREYWLGMAGIGAILAELAFVTLRLGYFSMGGAICGFVCIAGFVISMIIPTLSGLVRRMHDTGRSGWIVAFGLVIPSVIKVLNHLILFGVMESAMHYRSIPTIYTFLKILDGVASMALVIGIPNILIMSLLDTKKENNKWMKQ